MNTQLLQQKMDDFFASVSPKELIKEFQEKGYIFETIEPNNNLKKGFIWDDVQSYVGHVNISNEENYEMSWFERIPLVGKLLEGKLKNKTTPNYSGLIFCINS